MVSSNWQHKFCLFIFITNQQNLMFCVDKMKYEYLAIISNLKYCQFATKIVIFNLCILYELKFSRISRVKPSRKFPLQFMSIHSNDNISKIAKLTTRELPHLAKTAKIMAYTVCCQFEDLQIILPKIIPMSHHNIYLWQMRAHFFAENLSLSFGTYM